MCYVIREYSCAMKSHFRKFGNQMSGSGNKPRNPAKLGVSRHFKEIEIYDKSIIHLPRQRLMDAVKTLSLLDSLRINEYFTPNLYLWKIGSE